MIEQKANPDSNQLKSTHKCKYSPKYPGGDNRNGYIDAYRFIASVIIIIYHSYHLYNVEHYPFKTGWIFVEAFFCLTGFFTCQYLEKKKSNKLSEICRESVQYTIKKYLHFLPYTTICVFVSLTIRHIVILKDFSWIMIPKAILESLTIIRGDSNVGVIWYLTALLPVLPLCCIVYRCLNKKLIIIASIICVVGFHVFLRRYYVFFPFHYLRAFVGLCIGLLCYHLYEMIKSKELNLFYFGLIILVIPILLCGFNVSHLYICVFCFIIGFATILSDKRAFVSNRITNLAGKLSFSIYLVSLNIADLIKWFCEEVYVLNPFLQYVFYFAISLILSIALEVLVNQLQQHSPLKKLCKSKNQTS